MLKVYGFSKVNAVARDHTRDLRVLWALEEIQLPIELAEHRQRDGGWIQPLAVLGLLRLGHLQQFRPSKKVE